MGPNTHQEIWKYDHCPGHHMGLEMDHAALLTKIIYGGSGIHVLVMLHVDHNVQVSLHVVSAAVALRPHDICKGPKRKKNLNLFIQNTMTGTCCAVSAVLVNKR